MLRYTDRVADKHSRLLEVAKSLLKSKSKGYHDDNEDKLATMLREWYAHTVEHPHSEGVEVGEQELDVPRVSISKPCQHDLLF